MADINFIIESVEIETAKEEEGIEGKFSDHRRLVCGSKVWNEAPIQDLETEGIYILVNLWSHH